MLSEENKKSEPFSYREKVRIFIVWCDREDSNLWPSGSEPNALSKLSYDRKCRTPLVGTTQYNTSECKMQTKIVSPSGFAARCGAGRR